MAGFFLFDTYARSKDQQFNEVRRDELYALLFGLCIGGIAATRAVDLSIAAPVAIAFAFLIARDFVTVAGERVRALRSALLGLVGFCIPFLSWLAFNIATYGGAFSGPYFSAAQSFGFYVLNFPTKFYSQILNSAVIYGEPGQSWIAQIPLFVGPIAVLPIVFFTRAPTVLKLMASAVILQFVIYYAYSDIVPTGTFRFNNVHYFKWLMPVLLAITVYVILRLPVIALSQNKTWLVPFAVALPIAALGVGLNIESRTMQLSVKTQTANSVALTLPDGQIDHVDLPGLSGSWSDIYFGVNIRPFLDGRQLYQPRDFHFYPTPEGARLKFVRPIVGGELNIDFGDKVELKYDLGNVVRGEDTFLGLNYGRKQVQLFPLLQTNTPYFLRADGNARAYLEGSWSGGEAWGRWIDGYEAEFKASIFPKPVKGFRLFVRAGGFVSSTLHPKTSTEIYANECFLAKIDFEEEGLQNFELDVDSACLDDRGNVKFVFRNVTPVSPKALGLSEDPRLLGIGIHSLNVQVVE